MRLRHRRRAFTLLEMVISIGLLIMLLSMTFWFYNSVIEQRTKGVEVSREAQLARVVLDQIATEVRQASAFATSFGPGIYGTEDGIEINTLQIPDKKLTEERTVRDKALVGQFDLRQVRYYIAWDYENTDTNGEPRSLGLARREIRTYLRDIAFDDEEEAAEAADDAELATKEELYAPEIKYLEVLYFDGATWWETWELNQQNALPQIVRITIGFKPQQPDAEEMQMVEEDFLRDEEELEPLADDRYTVLVRPPQADVFFGSRLTREASSFGESAGM